MRKALERFKPLVTASAVAALFIAAATSLPAQTSHIYGIHDESPMPYDWINNCPGDTAWITATEAIGKNPADTNGKAYSAPAGSTIVARLNVGYNPSGTIPLQSEYGDFAQRVKNFVTASSGCDTWVIGNETNLVVEWPVKPDNTYEYISPAMYADCFVQCYNAIKSIPGKGSSQKVVIQAIAPWGGPYGAGTFSDGRAHPGNPDNWCDYLYKILDEVENLGVTPDGIALHINSRGYGPLQTPYGDQRNQAGGLTLDFSWNVHRDWVQYGIPRDLWDLPLYATESNGLNYWGNPYGGAGPDTTLTYPAYTQGWFQEVYSSVNDWNQNAANFGLPIYRCVNMYRWDSDPWTINNATNRSTLLSDLASAATNNYQWPNWGGNSLNVGTPTGTLATGVVGSADSSITNYEPSKAFDGSNTTYWASEDTGLQNPHWLAADLGSTQSINGYVVKHVGATGSSAEHNTVGFLVETSNTSATGPWTLNSLVRNSTPGAAAANETSLVYDTAVQARYVRLYINDASAETTGVRGRIAELDIYTGTGSGPTPTPTPSPTSTTTATPTATPPPVTINVTGEMASNVASLSVQPSNSDDLNGILGTKISGGFHPAVTDPADMEPAFTDGVGADGLAGLLNDYPGEGTPAWSGYWSLAGGSPMDLSELRVFASNGADGRAFQHYDVYTTSDASPSSGSSWSLMEEEVIPVPFGTGVGSNSASLTRLTGSGGGVIALGITAIRLDLFATDNMDNTLHDDWNAGNGDDRDGAQAAFVSPIIIEIDAFYQPASTATPTQSPTPSPSPTPTPVPDADNGYVPMALDGNAPIISTGDISANMVAVGETDTEYVRLNFILGPWDSPTDTALHGSQNDDWFGTYDTIVDGYVNAGVEMYGLINSEAVKSSYGMNTQQWVDEYVDNAEAIIGHFKDRVRIFETVNEPNDWAGGTSARFEPYWMARAQEAVYRRVKIDNGHINDPSWQVDIISGPLLSLDVTTAADYLNDFYYQGINNNGWTSLLNTYGTYPVDGVGYHMYVAENSIDPATVRAAMLTNLDAIWGVITNYEGASTTTQIYVSEFGWRDDSTGSEANMAANLEVSFDQLFRDPRIAMAVWFCFADFPGARWGLYKEGGIIPSNRKEAWFSFNDFAANRTSSDYLVVDNDDATGYATTGTWTGSGGAGYQGTTYEFATAGQTAQATWTFSLPVSGQYDVRAVHRASANRVTSAEYTVSHNGGNSTVYTDQTTNNMLWGSLGTFDFDAGSATVTLNAAGSTPSGNAVIADAIQFVRVDDLSGTPSPTPSPSPTPTASCYDQYDVNIARDGLANVFKKLNAGQNATIVYLGGSVTQADGWRTNIGSWFDTRYPGKVTHINAGWSGTGSALGAGRFPSEVLVHNPDLVFVEFAVNDETGDTIQFIKRNYDGMVRQAWNHDDEMDLVFVETVAFYSTPLYTNGDLPHTVDAHYQIADDYGVPTSNVGWALYRQVLCDGVTWTNLAPDEVHPNATGHQIYSDALAGLLAQYENSTGTVTAHALPAAATDYPFELVTDIDYSQVSATGWTQQAGYLESTAQGAEVTVTIEGPVAALRFIKSADSGSYEVYADGVYVSSGNLYHTNWFTHGYPVAKTLSLSTHSLTVRNAGGGAVRLVNLWYGQSSSPFIVVDNDDATGYTTSGSWTTSGTAGYNDLSYQFALGGDNSQATWTANLAESGMYDVSAIYRASTNRVTAAEYSITHVDGTSTAYLDQTQNSMQWVTIGNFGFNAGSASVTLNALNSTPTGGAVIADAIQFVRTGPLPATPTPSPSPSPTDSPTPSPSPSPSPTDTPTPSPSPSATATPTVSPSPSPSVIENIVLEAEDFDAGANGTAYYDTSSGNYGGQYRSTDVDIETCSEGGYNVGWIDSGEWLQFSGVQATAGTYAVTLRVASNSAGGSFHLDINGSNATGTVNFAATGGWQTWTTVSAGNVTMLDGSNSVRLAMDASSWNVNYIEFDRVDPGADPVVNGSFEDGFTGGVGTGWTAWSSSWSNTITFGQASVNKHDGSYSQYWSRSDSLRLHGGVYQVVPVTNGQQYTLTAWMKRQAGANDQWMEFGYDLSGGTDAESGNVVYTKLEGGGVDIWVPYSATFTATGSTVSIFAKGGTYNQSGGGNYFYLDEVELTPN